LLVALVPNPNFKNVYRHPRNLMHSNREFSMTPEATQVQHKIYSLLLGLLKPARQYIDASVHGTTKLGAFFALLTHFATSKAEKLMVPHINYLINGYLLSKSVGFNFKFKVVQIFMPISI